MSEEAVVFRKPKARANVRKRERSEADGDEEASGSSGPGTTLEMMRELQRQRQRAKGVTLEAKGVVDEVEEALAAGAAQDQQGEHGLDSTFTSQTDSGEVDPNMLKYIEEQLHGEAASAAGASKAALDPEEAELYVTPAHLQRAVPGGSLAQAQEDPAQRWLAGIMEVPLSVEDKMNNLEEMEAAKRKMVEREAAKAAARRAGLEAEHQMTIPNNYNSNFHQHRRENAIARRPNGPGGNAGPVGGPDAAKMPSDGNAYGRFKAQVREQRR
jgi:hypothetical protein